MKSSTLLLIVAGLTLISGGGYMALRTPRGIRNNNPGNIRQTNQNWQGEIGTDDAGFVIFDTMQNGVRALSVVLINYQYRHGLNTVEQIINRYAPATENNSAAYVAHAAKALGVKKDEPISVEYYLDKLVEVIIKHENGQTIDSEIMLAGVSDGLTTKGLV